MRYYIGYSIIDNFYYFLQISYSNVVDGDKLIINNKDANIKQIEKIDSKISILADIDDGVTGFSYDGVLSIPKSNGDTGAKGKFTGSVKLSLSGWGVSTGRFVTVEVDRKTVGELSKFKSCWHWFLSKLNPQTLPRSLIYQPHKFDAARVKLYVPITVMTFNICSAFSWTGQSGVSRVADIICDSDADIILLQEVNESNFLELVENIKTRSPNWSSDYRVGLITKFTIDKIYQRVPLSPVYGALLSIVQSDDRISKIRVYNSHLDDTGFESKDKSIQLSNLKYGLFTDLYRDENDSNIVTVLAGDHNTFSHLDSDNLTSTVSEYLYNDGWFDSYREINTVVDTDKDYTFPNCTSGPTIIKNEIGTESCTAESRKVRCRIDYIYWKNGENASLIPVNSTVVNRYDGSTFPSDHNAVVSKFLFIH